MAFPETTIMINDLDDSINVLAMCLTFFSAKDLQDAQILFRNTQPSPLTAEIDRVLTKQKHILGDYLLQAHLSSSDDVDFEDDDLDGEELEEAEEGAESLLEPSEPALSSSPLGKFVEPKQEGRRLTKKELQERSVEE